jgi:hypothetical protein
MDRMRILILCAFAIAACGDGGGGGGGGGGAGSGIFPDSNPWNTDISGSPLDPKSDQYIASIGATGGLKADWSSVAGGNYGIPYVEVPADQKLVPVSFVDYEDESDPGPYPIPDNAPIEDGGDAHVIVVDRGNGWLYELYQGEKVSGGWQAANGAKWNLRSNNGRPPGWTSADAAGLPIFPGLARFDEVAAGEIKHALRFTVSRSQRGYVGPASHAAGSCALNSECPPMGLRLRLKASVDISGYPQQVRVVLTALKKYGMIVADNGSNWYISGAPAAGWIDDDLQKIRGIKGSDFEVVQSGAITAQ